jgi:1,4-alpha-glucan branching enzyme
MNIYEAIHYSFNAKTIRKREYSRRGEVTVYRIVSRIRRIMMRENSSKQKTKKIQFSLEAVEAKKVSLVGEFNNWNPDADPMQRDENGTWTKTKMLTPGSIEYKYFVDGEWIQDPENLRTCPNCFGTRNNVVKVIELDRASLQTPVCNQ